MEGCDEGIPGQLGEQLGDGVGGGLGRGPVVVLGPGFCARHSHDCVEVPASRVGNNAQALGEVGQRLVQCGQESIDEAALLGGRVRSDAGGGPVGVLPPIAGHIAQRTP